MNNDFWKQYNKSILNHVKQVLNYNDNNSFNYIEESFYPHVRDLVALTISPTQEENFNKNTWIGNPPDK